jgi:hypothetical protein
MEFESCGICGEVFTMAELMEHDDTLLCPKCFRENTVICTRCGERIWSDDNAGDSETPLCQSCYDRCYTTCEDCGRVIHQDDAYYVDMDDYEPRCYHCHVRKQETGPIHNYYFKPDPIFYGNDSNRAMGVELEVDLAGEKNRHAAAIIEIANQKFEHIYCKHDGSLEDGFEIVSHPMTLNYHLNDMPWREILCRAKELGYRSHQANSCGLHIHVSRNSFGNTLEEQDECIARILYFFEKHWNELLRFSRRSISQIERWAARYGLREHPKEILDHAKKSFRGERYTCVNLTNEYTIEFRIFRGTLKFNTFVATLQLIDRICDVALYLSDEELKAMSWSSFVAGCTQPELITYLKERRLYVNEPVDAEVEL